jgi:uncharacterized protein
MEVAMELLQIRRRQEVSLPSNLNDAVVTVLLADEPDAVALERRVGEELGLPIEDARAIVYRLVASFNARLFPPVTHLEVIHTEGCNLGCAYCFEKEMLGYRRMPPAVARAAVDLLFTYSREAPHLTIVHFGGEPTLNMPSVRLVTEYAEHLAAEHKKTLEFDMTSNGVLLSEEMVEYFASHAIKVLLSIDGLEASHDRYRTDKKGRGTFKRVMAGLALLKRRQPWIGVKMTVMPDCAHRLFDDVRGLYDLGINQFIIGYATGIEWPREAIERYATEMGRIYAWYKAHDGGDLRMADFDKPAEGTFYGCQAGKISVTVTVNGEVSPCAKVLAVDNRRLLAKLGDVTYGLTHMRNRRDLVTCAQLKAAVSARGLAEEFQGGCFASNYQDTGDLFTPNLQDHLFSVLERQHCAGCASHR